jgi:hypothetical protein
MIQQANLSHHNVTTFVKIKIVHCLFATTETSGFIIIKCVANFVRNVDNLGILFFRLLEKCSSNWQKRNVSLVCVVMVSNPGCALVQFPAGLNFASEYWLLYWWYRKTLVSNVLFYLINLLSHKCFWFSVIVKATNGPRYVVGCRRQIDKSKLKQGTRVALDMTTLTIMR